MAIYVWKCGDCSEKIEVERPMKDYKIGPETCPNCSGTQFERTIESATFILKPGGTGWHRDHYTSTGKPIR